MRASICRFSSSGDSRTSAGRGRRPRAPAVETRTLGCSRPMDAREAGLWDRVGLRGAAGDDVRRSAGWGLAPGLCERVRGGVTAARTLAGGREAWGLVDRCRDEDGLDPPVEALRLLEWSRDEASGEGDRDRARRALSASLVCEKK